jgi:hypothetical protein
MRPEALSNRTQKELNSKNGGRPAKFNIVDAFPVTLPAGRKQVSG